MKFINKLKLRQLHRQFVPIMVFPLLLTSLTGSLFHIAMLTGKSSDFIWLLDLHRGKFGRINLESIYPFFNTFGLLILLVTGVIMWLDYRSPRSSKIK